IAVTSPALEVFRTSYPELAPSGVGVSVADNPEQLSRAAAAKDVVCATSFESVHVLKEALDLAHARPVAAYYVQDYEPLFCTPGSERWRRAVQSYSLLEGCVLFAKTSWLCDIVAANTGKVVHKVRPSLDHSVYFPRDPVEREWISICAMVRPAS